MQNDSDSNNIIVFKDVDKMYPSGANGIHAASFSIQKNEFVCFMGPSGCGKSTILNLIAGLEQPTKGDLKLPTNVSVVFQNGALFPWLTVIDNVAFGLRMKGIRKNMAREQAKKYIDMLKLSAFQDNYPRQLSGGQRQRVGIARALAIQPEVLLLDEPFSALDETTRFALYSDLLEIWKAHQLTIVMVSHQIEESVFLSQRVIQMDNHEIQREIPIDLPYPRDVRNGEFMDKVNAIRSLLPKQA